MIRFILFVIFWSFCIYGILSLIKDFFEATTYNRVFNKTRLILTVKDAEEGIENYIRELSFGKDFYNSLIVIDLGSKDKTYEILNHMQNDCMNIKLLSKEEGKEYLEKIIE